MSDAVSQEAQSSAPEKSELARISEKYVASFLKIAKENEFQVHYDELTKSADRLFQDVPTPAPHVITPDPQNPIEVLFSLLVNEVNFKLAIQQTPEVDFAIYQQSWDNYSHLFNLLLSFESLKIELPPNWVWNVLDEFVSQLQSFHLSRSKYPADATCWNILTAFNFLNDFVGRSEIKATDGEEVDQGAQNNIFRVLGIFSLIEQSRLHCILGDYFSALQIPVDLTQKKFFFRSSINSRISLAYHLAFSYLMLRRYSDAIRVLINIVNEISRIELKPNQRDPPISATKKDNIWKLISIAWVLHPHNFHRFDESIRAKIKEKFGSDYSRMQEWDQTAFEETFSSCCPKFISINGDPQLALRHQLQLFMIEVHQQRLIPTIRSYLKLYSSISIAKLAQFVAEKFPKDIRDDPAQLEETCRMMLLCAKHKTNSLSWTEGSPISGSLTSETEFYIKDEILHVVDSRPPRKFEDYYIQTRKKLEEAVRKTTQ